MHSSTPFLAPCLPIPSYGLPRFGFCRGFVADPCFQVMKPWLCCAQQTGVHEMIGSNCLIVCLPEEEKTSIYEYSTLTPCHLTTSPLRHLASWACPAEPSATSAQL